ncbi:MAG TPA: type II secretion system F family protein [Terriglobales bacterium]|nr:type II secretion system F family protein [Terriglobales bacterium]
MAEFVVKMADERGRIVQQVENGHSASEVRDRFALQGYLVYDIHPRGLFSVREGFRGGRKTIKLDQFIIFNSQFLTLFRAGLPILTALDLLAKQQKDPFFRSVLEDVRQRVKSGESLSHAFEQQQVASKIYTTTLLAGEKSGNLDEVLARYIAFQKISMAFRKKLLASLVYPALLVVSMMSLFALLIVYVVPRFGELYGTLNADLPAMTTVLLAIGTNAQKLFPFILVAIIATAFFFMNWRKSRAGAETIDRFRLSLPLFGGIWLKYQISMFARTLSTLLAGGLPLVPALETAGSSIDSRQISLALARAAQSVREGHPLAQSLEQTKIFPELAIEMVAVGESTGALPQMLTSVGEFYDEDVQTALAATLALIEPVILIVMGIVVAFVLLSLYLPIFTLGSAAAAR